jgi:tRNA nucleotidyltransferase (CCA-adding enzyme)
METLGMDPLRLLRCVRFAARFGFELDPDLAAAMADEALQKELKHGIARQRIATEVTKMLTGADSVCRQSGLPLLLLTRASV